jgi:ribonuclease Z
MVSDVMTLGGTSVAGVETCVEVPSLKLALDMGRCTRRAVGLPTVLVSHGHLDHAGALPQHAARRSMMGMTVGTYVVPSPLAPDVEKLFNAAGVLDGTAVARKVVPLEPGQVMELGKNRFLRPFRTFHRVVSQGYAVWERRKQLKAEFEGTPGVELGRLRQSGVEVDRAVEVVVLAFTGDTRVEVLEEVEEVRRAETLVMEVSFLDATVSVEEARAMGHIHLDEVLQRQDLLRNRDVVFCHFSARYSPDQVRSILAARLPDGLRERVRPLL